MTMHATTRAALIFALLLPLAAMATNKPPEPPKPEPAPTANSGSDAAAEAAAAAAARARAQSESDAQAAAVAQQRQAMLANLNARGGDGGSVGDVEGSSARGSGVGSVDVAGDSSSYNSRAYAVGLPALVGAPAVMADCLRHSRGGGVASAGVTGGTFYDKDCRAAVERAQVQQECFAMADRLALWGRPDAAVEQLTQCGAIRVQPLPPVAPVAATSPAPPVDVSGFATKTDMARLEEKIDRAFTRSVSK